MLAVLVSFATFANLESLFSGTDLDHGLSEPALVVLFILVFNGALVGLCVGLLLPVVSSGFCFGGMIALLFSSVAISYTHTIWLEYPFIGPAVAAVGAAMATG